MKIPALLSAALVLSACGRTIAETSAASSQMGPADAFKCVLDGFKTQGYSRTSYDTDKLEAKARKPNPKITISNVQFRRAYDMLDVTVKPAANGETRLDVTAKTAAEFFNQAGTYLQPLKTTDEAKAAAQALAQRCGGNTAPAEAPQPAES
jgi:hypothetical protein